MTRRWKILAGIALAVTGISTACSLVVDTNKDQCATDGDCHTAGALCLDGVCLYGTDAAGMPPSEAGPADADLDCTPKVPVSQSDFLNETCTSAQCIDFDDCARLGLCGDAALPDLVTPPDGGVGDGGTK